MITNSSTQKPTYDPRIKTRLDETELKYEIEDDGTFAIPFHFDNTGRTHTAFVNSDTFEFHDMEIREIFAIALQSDGPFDPRTANILLHENSTLKAGAWSVESDSENDVHFAVFRIKVSADLPTPALIACIECAIEVADQMEARLSGRDEF